MCLFFLMFQREISHYLLYFLNVSIVLFVLLNLFITFHSSDQELDKQLLSLTLHIVNKSDETSVIRRGTYPVVSSIHAPIGFMTKKPRSFFLASYNATTARSVPLMVDHFSYKIGNDLHLDAIINLKYLNGERRDKTFLSDLWTCHYKDRSTVNIFTKSNIFTLIIHCVFANMTMNSENDTFTIKSNKTNCKYVFSTEFIPNFTEQQYFLSICTSISYYNPDQLEMYIQYYFFHGVDTINLYINGDLVRWTERLKKYRESGIVNLIDFTFPYHQWLSDQHASMNSCLRRNRFKSKYVLFNDPDEFFVPTNISQTIVDVLNLYDRTTTIPSQFMVGSSYQGCGKSFRWNGDGLHSVCKLRNSRQVKGRQKFFTLCQFDQTTKVHKSEPIKMRWISPAVMYFVHFKNKPADKEVMEYATNKYVDRKMHTLFVEKKSLADFLIGNFSQQRP